MTNGNTLSAIRNSLHHLKLAAIRYDRILQSMQDNSTETELHSQTPTEHATAFNAMVEAMSIITNAFNDTELT